DRGPERAEQAARELARLEVERQLAQLLAFGRLARGPRRRDQRLEGELRVGAARAAGLGEGGRGPAERPPEPPRGRPGAGRRERAAVRVERLRRAEATLERLRQPRPGLGVGRVGLGRAGERLLRLLEVLARERLAPATDVVRRGRRARGRLAGAGAAAER